MKKLAGQIDMGGTLKREDRVRRQGGGYFSFVAAFILMGGTIFGVLNFRTHLIDEAERLNAEAVKVKTKIDKLDREIAYKRIRHEELKTLSYIQEKNISCNLGLQDAQPSQVRRIVLIHRTNGIGELKTAVRSEIRTASK